jgi:hypothetical protein
VAIRLTGAELFHSGVMCDGSRSAWSGWPSARCWKRCRACWCLPRVLRLERRAAGADGGEADQRGGPGKQHGEEGDAGIGQGRDRRQVEALAAGQLTLTPVTLWADPVMLIGTVAGTALNAARADVANNQSGPRTLGCRTTFLLIFRTLNVRWSGPRRQAAIGRS